MSDGALLSAGRERSLANLRPFQPGQSGNPTGMRPTFAALIRMQTGDGAELVAFALDVLRGKKRAPMRTRLQAMAWLADRGWGSVTQSHEISGPGGSSVVFTLRLGERGELLEEVPDD